LRVSGVCSYSEIDVSHIAATAPGFEITVKVKLIEVDARRLVFKVEAHDGIDLITRGRHERFIINKDKFDRKMAKKIESTEQVTSNTGKLS
jgi:fluoroacetyl-CoA thioesterase